MLNRILILWALLLLSISVNAQQFISNVDTEYKFSIVATASNFVETSSGVFSGKITTITPNLPNQYQATYNTFTLLNVQVGDKSMGTSGNLYKISSTGDLDGEGLTVEMTRETINANQSGNTNSPPDGRIAIGRPGYCNTLPTPPVNIQGIDVLTASYLASYNTFQSEKCIQDLVDGVTGEKGDKGDTGEAGVAGTNGKSAYQSWLDLGNSGSEADYQNSLKGADGVDGATGAKGDTGEAGVAGTNGINGKSAYQSWLDLGNSGSETDYQNSLKGADGVDGATGQTGAQGPQGVQGLSGETGKSAYQSWLDLGNSGSETDYQNSLKGADGIDGATGQTGAQGPQGVQGLSGETGATGLQGPAGADGADGDVATYTQKIINGQICHIDENGVTVPESCVNLVMATNAVSAGTDKFGNSYDVGTKIITLANGEVMIYNYIGNLGSHIAGGDLDMNKHDIRKVSTFSFSDTETGGDSKEWLMHEKPNSNRIWFAFDGTDYYALDPTGIPSEQYDLITYNFLQSAINAVYTSTNTQLQNYVEKNSDAQLKSLSVTDAPIDDNDVVRKQDLDQVAGDDLGIGFIVQKTGQSNTTIKSKHGENDPIVPIVRLGERLGYNEFDDGKSVEIFVEEQETPAISAIEIGSDSINIVEQETSGYFVADMLGSGNQRPNYFFDGSKIAPEFAGLQGAAREISSTDGTINSNLLPVSDKVYLKGKVKFHSSSTLTPQELDTANVITQGITTNLHHFSPEKEYVYFIMDVPTAFEQTSANSSDDSKIVVTYSDIVTPAIVDFNKVLLKIDNTPELTEEPAYYLAKREDGVIGKFPVQDFPHNEVDTVFDYAAFRAYSDALTELIVVKKEGIEGVFSKSVGTDDGGIYIEDANGQIWKRVFEEYVSVRWYDAAADGVTDDYLMFKAALDYAEANDKINNVYVPTGSYAIATGLAIPSYTNFYGDGMGRTIIVGHASGVQNIFVTGGSASACIGVIGGDHVTIRDFTLDKQTNNINANGVSLTPLGTAAPLTMPSEKKPSFCTIQRVEVLANVSPAGSYQIWNQGATNTKILDCVVTGLEGTVVDGIEIYGGDDILIQGNTIINVGSAGIWLFNGGDATAPVSNVRVVDNFIDGANRTRFGLYANFGSDVKDIIYANNTIINCTETSLGFSSENGFEIFNFNIQNNTVRNSGGIGILAQVGGTNIKTNNISIANNTVLNTATDGIFLSNVANVLVSGNQVDSAKVGITYITGSSVNGTKINLLSNVLQNIDSIAIVAQGVGELVIKNNSLIDYNLANNPTGYGIHLPSVSDVEISSNSFKHGGATETKAVFGFSNRVDWGINTLLYTPTIINKFDITSTTVGTVNILTSTEISSPNLTQLELKSTGNAVDEKRWVWQTGSAVGAGVLRLRSIGDSGGGTNGILFNRTGSTITDVQFPTGNIGIGVTPTEKLHVAGNILASGTITPSDRKLKTNIVRIRSAIQKVQQIGGYNYELKANGEMQIGVLAQEIEKVLPNAVKYYEDFKAVNYQSIIPLLIEAIKEQQGQIEELKKQ